MIFNDGQVVHSTKPGQTGPSLWRVVASQFAGKITMVMVEDKTIKQPLYREFVGATLNLHNRGKGYNPLHILDYKNQFIEACECAAGNFSGLPEPIDYFTINNNDPGVPPDEAKKMPFIIFHYGDTTPVNGCPYWVKDERQLFNHLKKLAYSVGFTMRALNNKGIAQRQVTLQNLRFLQTIKSYVIAEFFSLCRFDRNGGQYDPHRPHLVLNPLYSAPECFSTEELSPATDVYALAILLLQYMGARIEKPIKNENDVITLLADIEKQHKFAVRPSVVRALKLALRTAPRQRPREFSDFINIFTNKKLRKPQRRPQKPQNRGRQF